MIIFKGSWNCLMLEDKSRDKFIYIELNMKIGIKEFRRNTLKQRKKKCIYNINRKYLRRNYKYLSILNWAWKGGIKESRRDTPKQRK